MKCNVWSAIFMCTLLMVPVTNVNSGGMFGDGLQWVGDRTGIKPFKKAAQELDKASRDIKKEVPVIGDIEEAVSRPVRETVKWIENNPEEALAIVAVVAVGWAACVDGCTLVGSLLVDGATVGGTAGGLVSIPLVAIEPEKEKTPDRQPVPENNTPVGSGYKPKTEEEYPHKYSKKDHANGLHDKPPIIKYRTLDDSLGDIFNEFSPPTKNILIRVPENSNDPAGGTFLSPRTTNDPNAVAAYGKDARRIHGATDFLMSPGTPVIATMTGKVEAIWKTKTGFTAINIRAQDGTQSRVLYVFPDNDIKVGVDVKAGSTVLGKADNLLKSDRYKNVPNHVHVDFTDYKGRRFDPWSNKVTTPLPPKQ